ncbi:MAG TPA: hypothetical protein VIW73_02500 [Candidatus Cybelea sp.]
MKLLFDGARPFLAGVAGGVLFVAGCSSGRSLPGTGPSYGVSGMALEGFVPDVCTNPKIFKVCVKPGGSGKLGLKLTCRNHNGGRVPCGKVHWSTKMSHAGLTGAFQPNPGNPTVETVTATKSTPKGHYSQAITVTCTGVPSCVVYQKGAVWVI